MVCFSVLDFEVNEILKKLEDDIQNLTDSYIRKVDKLLEIKERDMMAV